MSHLLPHEALDSKPSHPLHIDAEDAHMLDVAQGSGAAAHGGPPPPTTETVSAPAPSRKKRKTEQHEPSLDSPGERRRLRRSHEACARCRSKKIKCDSKLPKCSACMASGTPCEQEDRHRQMLTPRGHTEHLERIVHQLVAIVRRYDSTFDLQNIDDVLASMGIQVPPNLAAPIPTPFAGGPSGPPPNMYMHGQMQPVSYGAGGPYSHPPPGPMPMQGPPPPPSYAPQIHPQFQQPPAQSSPPMGPPSRPSPPSQEVPGQDPQSDDMSSTQALAKNFGVSSAIMHNLPGSERLTDREDLAVGLIGLSSGRDKQGDFLPPRHPEMWVQVHLRHPVGTTTSSNPANSVPPMVIYLPKDRQTLHRVLDAYFIHLNIHRPVFRRTDFQQVLDDMYANKHVTYDPGYLCSLYLILALGTLSEMNRQSDTEQEAKGSSPTVPRHRHLMPNWPEHEEFFIQALIVKPDLRVTISSLQALILLHWYLYTERQQRTLWRLVGSLVRLSIELGLHHDPTTQFYYPDPSNPEIRKQTFNEEQCELRIRLWAIVMIHDRGTSILLGRPLAIAPHDTNTPQPSRHYSGGKDDLVFSENFALNHPIADIQADIIISLYGPNGTKRQSADQIMRSATRIMKSMVEFRRQLPESYKRFYQGTEDWEMEKKSKLVETITEDQGLAMLKLGIARILLLRALFNSKELPYHQRHKALVDAIVTSHNIIIIHNQLIRFPNIGFFVSPIPLHIAAMVICYGHMSGCDRLPIQTALQDVWLALDMLPRFRWRWERKDVNGEHPLIARLVEKVYNVSLNSLSAPTHPALIPEQDWDTDSPSTMSPASNHSHPPAQSTPTMQHAQYGSHYGPGAGPTNGSIPPPPAVPQGHHGGKSSKHPHTNKNLAEVPPGLFYPFYPEDTGGQIPDQQSRMAGPQTPGAGPSTGVGDPRAYSTIFAALANTNAEGYGSQNTYMLEEKDPGMGGAMPMHWMGMQQGPPDGRYMHPPPQ